MTLIRAAASSIASGRRSSRAHSCRDRSRPPPRSGMNCGRALPRPFHEQAVGVLGASGSSLQTVSPVTPSDSRLVARTRTPRHDASKAAASSAHASTTCSQLSSTSNRSRSRRYPRRASGAVAPRGTRTSSTRAVSTATSGGTEPGPSRRATPRRPAARPDDARAPRRGASSPPAWAGQRHQTGPAQRLANRFQLTPPSHQRRQQNRHVVHNRTVVSPAYTRGNSRSSASYATIRYAWSSLRTASMQHLRGWSAGRSPRACRGTRAVAQGARTLRVRAGGRRRPAGHRLHARRARAATPRCDQGLGLRRRGRQVQDDLPAPDFLDDVTRKRCVNAPGDIGGDGGSAGSAESGSGGGIAATGESG